MIKIDNDGDCEAEKHGKSRTLIIQSFNLQIS